jgi:hypothetical protein
MTASLPLPAPAAPRRRWPWWWRAVSPQGCTPLLAKACFEGQECTWAAKLRARLIGDFTPWKDHDAYQRSFERVLRDLTKPKVP